VPQEVETIKRLHIYPVEGSGCLEDFEFDFADFSDLVRQYLPNVSKITIWGVRVRNFVLEGLPNLKRLVLVNTQHDEGDGIRKLRLYAPRLEEMIWYEVEDLMDIELLTKGHPDHDNPKELSKFRLIAEYESVRFNTPKAFRESGRAELDSDHEGLFEDDI